MVSRETSSLKLFLVLLTMSQRVSRKSVQRAALASLIEETGTEVMPCTNCFRRKKVCRISEDSSRCSECVKIGRSCDGTSVASSRMSPYWDVLLSANIFTVKQSMREKRRLDSELARSELELQEALARVTRLRRQRDAVQSRTRELFNRGMRDLDESDGVRSQEEAILDEQQAIGTAQSLGAVGVIDWSAILPEVDLFGAEGAGAAPVGGNPSFSVEHSSSVP